LVVVELVVGVFGDFAWDCPGSAVAIVLDVPVEAPEVEPAFEPLLGAFVVAVPLPPQPARRATVSNAASAVPPTPPMCLKRDALIENLPSGELIGSTGSWPARDRVATAV
jgi:hypothetical protein